MLTKHSGLVAATLAALLTTACGASEPPEPTEGPSSDTASTTAQEPPLTAEAALGDLTAVDFCAFLDEKALAGAEADVDFTVPGFQHCSVGVATSSTKLTLMIGGLYDKDREATWPSEDETLARSVHRQSIEAGDACLRTLLFADGIGVQIFAQGLTDAGPVDRKVLCRVADAATDGVQEAAFSEEQFTRSFRPGSLAELEPCELLDETTLAEMYDASMVGREDIGGHGCAWGMGAPIELDFEVSLLADTSEFSTRIAGRPTKVVSDDMSCVVSTPHIEFSPDEPNAREVLSLTATTFDDRSCDAAHELAELVWPALPESQS